MSEEDNYDDEELKEIQSFLLGSSSAPQQPPPTNYNVYSQNSQQLPIQPQVNIAQPQIPIGKQQIQPQIPQQYVSKSSQTQPPTLYAPKPAAGGTPITASTVINKPPATYIYQNTSAGTQGGYNPNLPTVAGYKPGVSPIIPQNISQINTGQSANPIRYTQTIGTPTPAGYKPVTTTTTNAPILPQSTPQPGLPTTSQYKPPITTATTTTTANPKPPNPFTSQFQNHFNALALAYRNNILPRNELIEHLEILFGKHNTTTYIEKIDGITPDRVPPLPKDFDIGRIKEQTPRIKELAISSMKPSAPQPLPTPTTNSTSNIPSQNIRSVNPPTLGATFISQVNQNSNIVPMNTTTNTTSKDLKRKKPEDNKEDEKQNLKDLNDITKIANIDMKNETDSFLLDYDVEADENYVPEVEPLFLNPIPLRKKLTTIASRNGLRIGEENNVVEYISLACQDYLRTTLEFLIRTSHNRIELQKDDIPYSITGEIRNKLLQIEKRDREENERLVSERRVNYNKSSDNFEKKNQSPMLTISKSGYDPEPPQLKSTFLMPTTPKPHRKERVITKRDCLFSQSVIKPHIIVRHELLKKSKKLKKNLNSPILL